MADVPFVGMSVSGTTRRTLKARNAALSALESLQHDNKGTKP